MSKFVAEYKLASVLPENWEVNVEKLATDSGVTATASIAGNAVSVRCDVPPNSTVDAGTVAKSFFDEVPAVLTGPGSGTRVHLMNWGPVPPRFIRKKALLLLFFHLLGFVALVCGGIWLAKAIDAWLAVSISLGVAGLLLGACFRHTYGEGVAATQREAEALQANAEQLKQELARNEDPKQVARREMARISHRVRAGQIRRDAEFFKQRSLWGYRGAFFFFLLSVAGPGIVATLLLRNSSLEWHVMGAGFALAVVPLTIGNLLLRHEAKLREQYKVVADEVAILEKKEIAQDYALICTPPVHEDTVKRIIDRLLEAPPASSSAAASPVSKEDLEGHAVASKIVDAVTAVLSQKKP